MEKQDVNKKKINECVYCRSNTKPGALKCASCFADLSSVTPNHGGTCPLCKNAIHEMAVRCMHCKSWISGDDTVYDSNQISPSVRKATGIIWDYGDDLHSWASLPKSWRCEQYKDWTTFNPQTRMVWIKERCVELYSGETRNRPIRQVRVSQREVDDWYADNS